MDEKIKAQPYRAKQVAWDLVPLGVSVICWIGLCLVYGADSEQASSGYLVPLFTLPIVGALWMQLSAWRFLHSISRREYREQLALTGISALDYLRAELRPWMISHLAVSLVIIIPLGLSGIVYTGSKLLQATSNKDAFGAGAIIYVVSMHAFALMAGHRSMLGRLRSLCHPKASDSTAAFASAKWIMIIVCVPALIFICALGIGSAIFMGAPDSITKDRDYYVGVSLMLAPVIFDWLFYRNLQRAWQKAADEYFRFE